MAALALGAVQVLGLLLPQLRLGRRWRALGPTLLEQTAVTLALQALDLSKKACSQKTTPMNAAVAFRQHLSDSCRSVFNIDHVHVMTEEDEERAEHIKVLDWGGCLFV